MQKRSILIVEDDAQLAAVLVSALTSEGYQVAHQADGEQGLREAQSNEYDLLVLDHDLPGRRGMDICREIRRHDENVRILMLTAIADETSKVVGLELGADDYLAKPFSMRELVARVRALLRRGGTSAPASDVLRFGPLEIDTASRLVALAGSMVELTKLEFDLLLFLASNAGRAISVEDLMENVWGHHSSSQEQTVRAQISRLKKRIFVDETGHDFIENVRGYGYRFIVPGSPEDTESTP